MTRRGLFAMIAGCFAALIAKAIPAPVPKASGLTMTIYLTQEMLDALITTGTWTGENNANITIYETREDAIAGRVWRGPHMTRASAGEE